MRCSASDSLSMTTPRESSRDFLDALLTTTTKRICKSPVEFVVGRTSTSPLERERDSIRPQSPQP